MPPPPPSEPAATVDDILDESKTVERGTRCSASSGGRDRRRTETKVSPCSGLKYHPDKEGSRYSSGSARPSNTTACTPEVAALHYITLHQGNYCSNLVTTGLLIDDIKKPQNDLFISDDEHVKGFSPPVAYVLSSDHPDRALGDQKKRKLRGLRRAQRQVIVLLDRSIGRSSVFCNRSSSLTTRRLSPSPAPASSPPSARPWRP